MIVVVMGVAGSGKTTVGRALAAALAWPFVDADDVHPPENIARMRAAVPLTDADREPWLEALRELLRRADADGRDLVLACSALRARFRERLRGAARDVRYVFLQASPELIARRLGGRAGHFLPSALLESQFSALEAPEGELVLDASEEVAVLVERIGRVLARG